ncbi:MAG TPA: peptidase domain-containing ABC transporter [Longimicrobium sp.]|jgi:ABC-type bacteriocin/lantibiotic exporter with double-glycine peptidase domain
MRRTNIEPERSGGGEPRTPHSRTDAPSDIPSLRIAFSQFWRLTLLIHPYWGKLAKGMVVGLAIGLLGMVGPYLTKLLIDHVYPTQDVELMHLLVGGVLAISITTGLLSGVQSYYSLWVTSRLNNATTLLFFNHLQHLPMRFFEEQRVGELMSRFGDLRMALQNVARVFQTLFVQGVYLFLVPPFLLILEWRLGLMVLVTVPLSTILVALAGRPLRDRWKQSAEAYGSLSALQVETLSQIRTFKSMGMEAEVFERARSRTTEAMEVELKAGVVGQLVGTGNGILNALNIALITWYGWRLILFGEMSLGDYIAFTMYMGFFHGPLTQFVALYSEFQQTSVNLHRIFEYLDLRPEQDPTLAYDPAAVPLRTTIEAGEVQMEHVAFGYSADELVLHDVSLEIPGGSTLAVVGASGSGKTTLLRLLSGLEEPGAGLISIDGHPIEEISLRDLRRQVGTIWQEYSLLSGTIRDNLTMGAENVPGALITQAVRVAQLEEFIRSLPDGLDTPVAEFGASVSGGQRQRIAIARALLRQPQLLLLDEATANIDPETEWSLLRDLLSLRRGLTTVWVTHRVNTAHLADRICVMEHGRVVGLGSHDEMLQRCEAYRGLWHASGGRLSELQGGFRVSPAGV